MLMSGMSDAPPHYTAEYHQGEVTSHTTSPRPTGPIDPFELSTEMLIMLGGIGVVIVVLGVMAKKRK